MRILFIRHGDPDYVNDTLTEKGHREAKLLSDMAEYWNMGDCYQSPLGRAQATASYCLRKLGKAATTVNWLQEFPARLDINLSKELQSAFNDTKIGEDGRYENRIVWDVLPSYWTNKQEYFGRDTWRKSEIAQCSDIVSVYDEVTGEFDELLAGYGYVREKDHYRVISESKQTVTFFCHFGITAALLSHLWNVSPFTLWHGLALAPTSVTEIVSEEREQGVAYFRGLRLGDQTHLYLGKECPSFAARFCETYSDKKRH